MTPKQVNDLRPKVIRALLDGKITTKQALDLFAIPQPIYFILACSRLGIEL